MRATTVSELVEAVRERMEVAIDAPVVGFEARVIRNVLAIVERELAFGRQIEVLRGELLADYGEVDEEALAVSIRSGRFDDRAAQLRRDLLLLAEQQLRIDNPRW
jgi:hypothetical protein